jgi:hypothetical protein
MTSPALDAVEIEQFRASSEVSGFRGSLWNVPASWRADSVESTDPAAKDGSCLRGVVFALGLEACVAFAVYGVWQMAQVLR